MFLGSIHSFNFTLTRSDRRIKVLSVRQLTKRRTGEAADDETEEGRRKKKEKRSVRNCMMHVSRALISLFLSINLYSFSFVRFALLFPTYSFSSFGSFRPLFVGLPPASDRRETDLDRDVRAHCAKCILRPRRGVHSERLGRISHL